MEIASVTGFRYRLPLRAPLRLGAHTIAAREGLLVRVTVATGGAGWGDAAPLPGFSSETLDEAAEALDAAASALRGRAVEEALAYVAAEGATPSVRFGLELALFDLRAQAAATPLPAVLGPAPRSVVSLNGLIAETGPAALAAAERLPAAGYRAVKLKVGRQAVADDAALVRRVKARLGAAALRLDANRAWSLDAARAFAEAVADVPIAYVEEPLADPSALPTLAAETALPVALDERVQEGARPAAPPYARAVVLKPPAAEAVAVGATPVLSAAFESGVGLRGLVALAACLGADDVPAGLDTYRRFSADVLRPRLPLSGPRVDVAAVMAADRTFNPDVLSHASSMIA